VSVAIGEHHACAPLAGEKLSCWGEDFDGELGNGQRGFSAVATGVFAPLS